MKTHLIENLIVQEDRRVEKSPRDEGLQEIWGGGARKICRRLNGRDWNRRKNPYNYSKPQVILSVLIEPQPVNMYGLHTVTDKGEEYAPMGYTDTHPYKPKDLIIKPEEWWSIKSPQLHSCSGPCLRSNILDQHIRLFNKMPPSTMPLSLAPQCKEKHEVIKVLGGDLMEILFSEEVNISLPTAPPQYAIKTELLKKWHFNILGEAL